MKHIFTFFNLWDKRIWNDIDTNKYFGTLCLWITSIFGALEGGAVLTHKWFDWGNGLSTPTFIISLLIVIIGLNIFESIVAASPKVAILRSFFVILVFLIAFVLGFALSILVISVVALGLVALLFYAIFLRGGLFGGTGKYILNAAGERVDLKEGLLGGLLHGSDGKTYDRGPDNTVTPRD